MRPFSPYVDSYWDVENQLAQHIQRRASKAASLEYEKKRAINTVADFEERRDGVKQAFFAAIGGLPPKDTPLHPRLTGVMETRGYTVEKIIFESLPQFYVTTNLYLPKVAKPSPAILFLCGHAREAKAYPPYQKVCIALVRAGFVVLALDPYGQGERMGYVNPKTHKLDIEWGTEEHSHAGLQCTLAGNNIARYFIHDAVRGLDYLCTRPEVDPDRLGVTGNSGGGTQTSYVMMADPRVKAAIPCTYITAREHYLWTGQAHDAEQNIFGAFTKGINYDDLLTSIAPRPVQLGGVASDFFTIEGTLQSAQRAKDVYALYGQPENFRLVISPGTHEYTDLLRHEAVNWFRWHLMEGKLPDSTEDIMAPSVYEYPWGGDFAVATLNNTSRGDAVEKSPHPDDWGLLPEEALLCTAQGQVSLEYPKGKTVFHLNKELWAKTEGQRAGKTIPFSQLEKAVWGTRDQNPVWVRIIDSGISRGLPWKKLFFFTESDIAVTGIWMESDSDAPPWLALLEDGTNAVLTVPSHVRDLALNKGNLLLLDVRGHGAIAQRPINAYRPLATYGTEFFLNYNGIMLEDSLLWMRAYDVVEALVYLHAVTGKRPSIYAEGWLGVVALAGAAAVESHDFAKTPGAGTHAVPAANSPTGVQSLELEGLLHSVADIINERFHPRDHRIEAFDLARLLDIQALIAHFGKRAKVNSWQERPAGN